MSLLRDLPAPWPMKLPVLVISTLTWRFAYYLPNTIVHLHACARQLEQDDAFVASLQQSNVAGLLPLKLLLAVARGRWAAARFWAGAVLRVLMEMVVVGAWFLAPAAIAAGVGALLCPDGTEAWPGVRAWPLRCAAWLAAAEFLCNAHTFLIIAPNHAGEDLWRFDRPCAQGSAEALLRCCYASANYDHGWPWPDLLYGWLNYQIEHHMFPDLTPLQLERIQPLIEATCKRHGVQYVKQNAFRRYVALAKIFLGVADMRRCVSVLPPSSAPSPLPT